MKKLFCTFICLLVGTFPLYAQGAKGKALVEGSKKMSEAASKRGLSGRVPKVGGITTGALGRAAKQQATQSSKGMTHAQPPKVSTPSPRALGTDATRTSAQDLRSSSMDAMQKQMEAEEAAEKARIERDIKAAEKRLEGTRRKITERKAAIQEEEAALSAQTFNADFGKSVLFTPNIALEKNPSVLERMPEAVKGFSMTVIKNTYQGKEEVFGVIPTHALPQTDEAADLMFGVTRNFHTQVTLPNGGTKLIPGKVVQTSAHSMLDITLVKFNPEDEKFLNPLELAEDSQIQESARWYGFANQIPMEFERTIKEKSLISVRTDKVDVPDDEFQGICGSPLVDSSGRRVIAIHTGVYYEYSYGTPARFIKLLIEAYHNGGKAAFNLELDGEVLTSLNVDEYISAFAIADESKQLIYKQDGMSTTDSFEKYSETKLRNAIHKYQGRYLILHSRTPLWVKSEKTGEFYLNETRDEWDTSDYKLREHVYDLKTHKLLEINYIDDPQEEAILYQLDGYPIRPRYY